MRSRPSHVKAVCRRHGGVAVVLAADATARYTPIGAVLLFPCPNPEGHVDGVGVQPIPLEVIPALRAAGVREVSDLPAVAP